MSQAFQDSNLSLPVTEDPDLADSGAVGSQVDCAKTTKTASVGSISEDAVDGWLGLSGHDTPSGSVSGDKQRDKVNIDNLQRKIEKIKERLKEEQNTKEDNVNEYLRVSNNPSSSTNFDRQQMQRIKTEFEKKNRRSTQLVSQLQKKLDTYKRNLKEVQQHGSAAYKPKRDFKQGFKDTGASIRDGISGFTGGVVDNIRGAKDSIVSKPKEFAHLIKNKYISGSTGDILSLTKLDDDQGEDMLETSKPNQGGSLPLGSKLPTVAVIGDEDACSDDVSGSGTSANHSSPNPQSNTSQHADHEQEFEFFIRELQLNRDVQVKAHESLDVLKQQVQTDNQTLKQDLEVVRYRNDRLEEQLNEITELHHDLTELHQHEIANIKQELASMEEKMEYQLEERTRDMQEMLDTCQTRITKMELQQQQQQLISMEGFENSNFRALITKLINVALALLAVVLVLVSTVVNMLSPFLTTRYRIMNTILLAAAVFVTYHNWEFLKQYATHILSYFEEIFNK